METFRKDLTAMMKKSGINAPWTPHDLRGAVASKLMNMQAGDQRVLQLGRWKSRKTFDNHYFKRTFYKEAKPSNSNTPLCVLLRKKVTPIEEQDLSEITDEIQEDE